MDRRQFLTNAVGSCSAMMIGTNKSHARPNHSPSPDAIGMLYDSTLCIGCQACVFKCQEVNHLEASPESETSSINSKLSIHTHNVIQVWDAGTGENKDQLDNGYAYIKRQCMHCVDPDCVSACPVSAMTKDPISGIVSHHKEYCVACRYCMVACPYNVPQYEYLDIYGQIQKCQFCNQQGVERLNQGLLPGCVEACPTGAVIYGKRSQLLSEAKRRLLLEAGSDYLYPLQTLDSGDTHRSQVPSYENYVFGEHDGGGTQVLVISGVPFQNIGLPELSNRAVGARAETMQHSLYKGMVLPMALFGAFLLRTRKNITDQEQRNAEDNQ
ncbi:hydrogenase 2 operon protein HybA [Vibrio sonorensis]|uniref:hydrogenase 2 operon protein HybA n=1 Tax=Vibrio sonorensis TaxID=1004316 RepID=UPI0008D94EB3|nr:hydrogenase 2 operon protein HybA [Vibrio sonorensis]